MVKFFITLCVSNFNSNVPVSQSFLILCNATTKLFGGVLLSSLINYSCNSYIFVIVTVGICIDFLEVEATYQTIKL